MEERDTIHFSKKVLFLSVLFLLVNIAWYTLTVISQKGDVYKTVAPKIVFAGAHDIQVKTAYDNEYISAKPSQSLFSGTSVMTGEKEFAEIVLENNVIGLDENTEIILKENNFEEFSSYESGLPRLVFELKQGSVWVNAFDSIEINMPQSSADLAHSIGIVAYTAPINRIMVVTGSADLKLMDESGKMLATYMVPLNNQVTYTDTQIVPEYAQLMPSKLKKELKLGAITQSIFEDAWVIRNIDANRKRLESAGRLITSSFEFNSKNRLYDLKSRITFVPQTKRELALKHADLILRYTLGGVQENSDKAQAKELLGSLDNVISGMRNDPLMKQLFAGIFFNIGTVDIDSPAYLVKEYLLSYILETEGPQVLRTYLADIRNNLSDFSLDQAEGIEKSWSDRWAGILTDKNLGEYTNQSLMLQRIMLTYSDRVTMNMLSIFNQSGQSRMAITKDAEETRFGVTEERMEISAALVSVYRYTAAKQYLKISYESLNIDELSNELASKKIFMEQAKLLAQRIEYADSQMHSAAQPIDETEFRNYLATKTRDQLLSENLKAFLEIGKAEQPAPMPPATDEVIQKFAEARIVIIDDDLIPQADNPFIFEVKRARLIERSKDGALVTFDATYDFIKNGVDNVVANGNSLNGNFELNDLVAILTQGSFASGQEDDESAQDITGILMEEDTDEALRSQITAQDLARQLVLTELTQAGIQLGGLDNIEVLDAVTLARFKVTGAYINNPVNAKQVIQIQFDYNSVTKNASEITVSEGGRTPSGDVPVSRLVETILGGIYEQEQEQQSIIKLLADFRNRSISLNESDIMLNGLNNIQFTNMRFSTLPIIVEGVYSLGQNKFVSVKHSLYSAENIGVEEYFTELTKRYVVDYLAKNGITISANMLVMSYPFRTIQVSNYEMSETQHFDFFLDITSNRLKDVKLRETGAKVDYMAFGDFLSIGGTK